MDGVPLLPPRQNVKRSAASTILRRDWPNVHRACINTYFSTAEFAVITEQGGSAAGYILKAVLSAEEFFVQCHAHRPVTRLQLDEAFAGECWYHFRRSRQFRRPQAVLWTAWHAMITERPEKIFKLAAAGRAAIS